MPVVSTATKRPRWRGSDSRIGVSSLVVQSGARRHGIAGIYGNPGIVVSVTYRI